MGKWLVPVHAGFTFAMFGLMLAVQFVVYPAFRRVEADSFAPYMQAHADSMVRVLAVLAPFEVILALWLFLDTPEGLSRSIVFLAGALLAVAWIATGLWFAPLHGRLQQGRDPALIEQLIRTNWTRTVLWAARGGLALWFVVKASS